jgi:cytochrome b subunit of formate dehydrogenase
MASTTDRDHAIVRNNRRGRLLHTALFLVTTVLLVTGWWIWRGNEGRQSVLAGLLDRSDVELHRQAGWLLAFLVTVAITIGARGTITFVRETLRLNRGDGRWFVRWPAGALTGRFANHKGLFDPGQRVANIAFVATFGTLIGTGIAITTLHGGPTFVWLVSVHRYATYVLGALILGHLLVVSGILPGYRGVWRAMHIDGAVRANVARRLWPNHSTPREPESIEEAPPARAPAPVGGELRPRGQRAPRR